MLRPAGADEVAAMAALHAQAFAAPWAADAFVSLFESPGVFAVVAEEGAMTGLVLMRAIAGEAEVLTLAVHPAHRRHGLGRAVLQAGLDLAAAAAAEAVFLEVAADNAAALALYRVAGFEAVGRRAGYYARAAGAGMDALVLRRTLNSPKG